MDTIPTNNLLAVIVDANILISICSKEQLTHQTAENAFKNYALQGVEFFAPNVIVAEVLFVLCQKIRQRHFNSAEHEKAVEFFQDYITIILPPPNGEATLIARAEEIRSGYGCSRTSDGLYLALAEELAKTRTTEFLTFDAGVINQAAKNAPTVTVNLLPI